MAKVDMRNVDVGNGHVIFESAHLAHVLFAFRLPWITLPEPRKRQALKKRVGDHMENGGGVSADAAGEEHVADLAAGRIGQHAFDVVLCHADGGRQ